MCGVYFYPNPKHCQGFVLMMVVVCGDSGKWFRQKLVWLVGHCPREGSGEHLRTRPRVLELEEEGHMPCATGTGHFQALSSSSPPRVSLWCELDEEEVLWSFTVVEPDVGVASRTTWRVSGGPTCQAVGAQVGSDPCILPTLLRQWIPTCAKWSRQNLLCGGRHERENQGC